jgi:hypothetical protein
MTARDAASRLSDAQRRVLKQSPETVDGRVLVPSMLGNLNHVAGWPAGLVEYYSAYYCRLTPLGLAVRQILKGQQ